MNETKRNKKIQSNVSEANHFLRDVMNQSFSFWHNIYDDSLINYPLIWKKALESNSEIMNKIEDAWKNNSKQNAEIQMQQFLELWAYAIKKSNFETAMKSMQDWEIFWRNATKEQVIVYIEVIRLIEKYWKDLQIKNFE